MEQMSALLVVALIVGLIGWFWLGSNDRSEGRASNDAPSERRVSLGSRLSIAAVVALVCTLAATMVPFLVVFVVGSTNKDWMGHLIWIIYLAGAVSWVVYSFLNPEKRSRK
jgi:ABC-type Fe3+ transport system permease subunit